MKDTKTITKTAVLLALLLALQAITASLGQFVTGSAVNCVLAIAAFVLGMIPAIIIALLSPFAAFFLGIGPQLIAIVPAIAIGNIVYVLIIVFVSRMKDNILSVLVAALAKADVLYTIVVKVLCSYLTLSEAQIAVFSKMFSWPQLVTALIGGVLAFVISRRLEKNK